jgi:hypothetical protein
MMLCIETFARVMRKKCDDILRPKGFDVSRGIKGGTKLTNEQREWLLDPRTMNYFKTYEFTQEERCEALHN